MSGCKLQNRIHLTTNASVMHRYNRASAGRNQPLQLRFIQVERVGTDIREHGPSAAQYESVRSGNEGERRDDNLVARLDIQEQGGHFKRMSAGGSQQRLFGAHAFFQDRVAEGRETPIATDLHGVDGLLDVGELRSDFAKPVERYRFRFRRNPPFRQQEWFWRGSSVLGWYRSARGTAPDSIARAICQSFFH